MKNAPIVLFVYSRLEHTRLTIEFLLRNIGSADHDLIIYSDAPKTEDKQENVVAVRDYIKNINGFRSLTVINRTFNYGLSRSIIDGVTEVLVQYDNIIVLEDDMITSQYFLTYMNQSLKIFADDERVVSIHGYCYPVKNELPSAFFLRGADCWGWATWRRGWALFNPNARILMDKLKSHHLIKKFDFNGSYKFSKMLKEQIYGLNDSWAVRWYASAFLADKLTLYPGKSLVHNIGNDNSGTHCGNPTCYDVVVSSSPINLTDLNVKHSDIGFDAFEDFFRKSRINLIVKVFNFIKRGMRKFYINTQ